MPLPTKPKIFGRFCRKRTIEIKLILFVFDIPPFENGTADNDDIAYDTKDIRYLLKEYKT